MSIDINYIDIECDSGNGSAMFFTCIHGEETIQVEVNDSDLDRCALINLSNKDALLLADWIKENIRE